jgi:hypothetical protein
VHKPPLLKRDLITEQIKDDIINALLKVKNIIKSPTSLELIHYITLLLESIVEKKAGIDKLALFNDILKTLFPNITEDELTKAEEVINFLLSNKLIKKIPILKKALFYASDILKKLIKT